MNLFGFEITRSKAAPAGLQSVSNAGGAWAGLWGIIREPFAGAWQKNITVESQRNLLAFSAVYACIALRADDVSKLRPRLTQLQPSGIWTEITASNNPLGAVLVKPNSYQTRIQFFAQWLTSKLTFGNTYVLKERDARSVVRALYILDPRWVTPLVAPDGAVYYQTRGDYLAGIGTDGDTFAASEIIHDRCNTFFHPLVGLSPIYACGSSATQGIRIQKNSATFFENMSQPSVVLTSPNFINDETAKRLKRDTEAAISGANIGRVLVAGDGLKLEQMTIPANDAQLIEQLKWTVEDVARAFKVPQYKLGGQMPTFNNAGAMNQDYYTQTLQADIEAIEVLLDEGLGLPPDYGTEFDLDGLTRMDPLGRAESDKNDITSGLLAPNEARAKRNLKPVKGGELPFMQQQNWPLDLLADRPVPGSQPAAPAVPALPAPTAPAKSNEAAAGELAEALIAKFLREAANA